MSESSERPSDDVAAYEREILHMQAEHHQMIGDLARVEVAIRDHAKQTLALLTQLRGRWDDEARAKLDRFQARHADVRNHLNALLEVAQREA